MIAQKALTKQSERFLFYFIFLKERKKERKRKRIDESKTCFVLFFSSAFFVCFLQKMKRPPHNTNNYIVF
tara:strand:- start:1248 stop:1457 length:210 start_codon:yes stop_codon:yes gene_type:complete